MYYEHTFIAIVALVIGFCLLASVFGDTQWLPSNQFELLLMSIGLITVGVIGIRRELWVREFEKKARE